jgi:PAS domain S-box-containing protein
MNVDPREVPRPDDWAAVAPVMIWCADQEGAREWNSAGFCNFTGMRLPSDTSWLIAVHPEDLQRCVDIFRTCIESAWPFAVDYRLMHRDGTYRWVMDRGVPRRDDLGGFVGHVGACVDVHERRLLEDQLAAHLYRLRQRPRP